MNEQNETIPPLTEQIRTKLTERNPGWCVLSVEEVPVPEPYALGDNFAHWKIHSAYVVEVEAEVDFNGYDTNDQFTIAPKGTRVQHGIYVLADGRLFHRGLWMSGK